MIQRLDRLTLDEARITAAQTLEVVYGLVQNVRVVMDGEQMRQACHLALSILSFRWQCIDRQCSECPRYVLRVTMKATWCLIVH